MNFNIGDRQAAVLPSIPPEAKKKLKSKCDVGKVSQFIQNLG
jgi:hypothetical protein